MNTYLNRCYELATLAGKKVKSNPQVGAVLVHDNKIIGEGYHEEYGAAHAEVNCLNSVPSSMRKLIPQSTLYVSLEPCCHHGKTPPCTDLIIRNKIPRVVIGTDDPHPLVAGNGIKKLRKAGIDVTLIKDDQAAEIIAPFTTFLLKKRPFITMKFAKSKDNFIGVDDHQVWLSNDYSKVLAHQLRAVNDAILVGTHTAQLDDPVLTTRAFPGENPIRMVIDKELSLPTSYKLFSNEATTVIFNSIKNEINGNIKYVLIKEVDYTEGIMKYCHEQGITRLLVEGGASLIKSFYKKNLWDRAYVIDTEKQLYTGIKAPNIHGRLMDFTSLADNSVHNIFA